MEGAADGAGMLRGDGAQPQSGEQVIFQGHPSWRAILGFYLKGILVAAIVGVIAKLFGAGSGTVFLVVLVIVAADRPDRLRQAGRDHLHDHRPPPQHQTRHRLPRDPGDPPGAGPERQLPPDASTSG